MIEEPYFLSNQKWYFYDANEKKYKLTEEAPPKAVQSYDEFYKTIEEEQKEHMMI